MDRINKIFQDLQDSECQSPGRRPGIIICSQKYLPEEPEEAGDAAHGIREGHDPDVPVGDVRQFVGQDADQFAATETPQEPIGEHHRGIVPPPGREGVHDPARQVVKPRQAFEPGPHGEHREQPELLHGVAAFVLLQALAVHAPKMGTSGGGAKCSGAPVRGETARFSRSL